MYIFVHLVEYRCITNLRHLRDGAGKPDAGDVLEEEVAGDGSVVGGGQDHGGVDESLETEVAEVLGLTGHRELLRNSL